MSGGNDAPAPAVEDGMTTSSKKRPATRPASGSSGNGKTAGRTVAIAAATAVGTVAAAVFGALKLGWLDRPLARGPGNAEHPVPDLAADAPTPGTERAPDAFRPDPTAPVPDSEREALRPATGAPPTLAAQRGEMANQTGLGG